MGSLKAPRPDGFQSLFYKKNWATMVSKVYEIEVLEGKGLPPTLNDTYLVLISKREHPELSSQFRPLVYSV